MEEVKRKLASIRVIAEIKPIEGSDNIELAVVDGWQCVVKKGEFKPRDLCIYFEIDSFLPIREEFEFLRKSSHKKMGDQEGFRLKTIKLRGQISQGLVVPLYSLPEIKRGKILIPDGFIEIRDAIGEDLTELLGVLKYVPPIPACLSGIMKGNFPSFIRKTDQERVQNIWNEIKDCKKQFEVTVKLDGTSGTYYLKDGVFGVCSRNMELVEDDNNTLWRIAKENEIERILRARGKNLALQGEVIGEGIQDNHEKIEGQQFYLFDIWDIDKQKYFLPRQRHEFCNDTFLVIRKMYKVPILEGFFNDGIKLDKFKTIDDILAFANGESLNASTREGVVFKSMSSDLTFKVISNEYLLKQE